MELTCHQTLVPDIIDLFVAIDSALNFGGFLVRVDSNTIQISHIDLNAGETGSIRGQGKATADCIKRDATFTSISTSIFIILFA